MSRKILVAGNGPSRKNLNLSQFDIIGCNAICRDMTVDFLVACDKRMVKEAITRQVDLIYTRSRWKKAFNHPSLQQLPDLPYVGTQRADDPMNWGSGPYALLLGCTMADHIYMAGFDLYQGNIYRATPNYNNKDVDPSYWIYQISKLFEVYHKKQFTIIADSKWILPKQWHLPNVEVDKHLYNKYNT